jgi:hypothetical protein
MAYHLEDLFQSINDIFYQVDEGKITPKEGERLAQNCSKAFLNDGLVAQDVKSHLMLSLGFSRGIIDGEQLKQLLTIYKEF